MFHNWNVDQFAVAWNTVNPNDLEQLTCTVFKIISLQATIVVDKYPQTYMKSTVLIHSNIDMFGTASVYIWIQTLRSCMGF